MRHFYLTSHSSATRHQWLNLFSTRHECLTSDVGLTRTRLVSSRFVFSLNLHLTGEFCLRISIRWRSMVRCTFSRVRIFAGTRAPVMLKQNRTILHRRISSHRLHHGHTVVLGQSRGDSASSVAGNVTMSTGFFSRALASMLSCISLTACQFVF